jgi:nucleoside-triphosphatase THEP1
MAITYTSNEPAEIASRFINNTSCNVFLTGNAGTGKTTFLKYIVANTFKKTAIVAPTGIAALNAGGVTIHSMFQLPFGTFVPTKSMQLESKFYGQIHDNAALLKHIAMHETKRRLLRELELLIVDEVSMLRADLLDAIDFVLRTIRKKSDPFGGVQLLFIGDMLQLPPVVKDDEWNVLNKFYNSPFFFEAKVLQSKPLVYVELEKIFRQQDARFIDLLNNLRNNRISPADRALLNQYYQPHFSPSPLDDIITLTTHNRKADQKNQKALDNLKGSRNKFKAIIEGDFPEHMYPIDAELEFKEGAQVMFIKNDSSGQQRFFNGKIAKIISMEDGNIVVKSHGEDFTIKVERFEWENNKFSLNPANNEIESNKVGSFKQYPIKLAWAITVHKSQGLTFDRAIIDVEEAFAAGQIYVALSRLRTLDGLILSSAIAEDSLKTDASVAAFGNSKSDKSTLQHRFQEESLRYLNKYLNQAFDFMPLRNSFVFHADSYTKTGNRSAKQAHAKWAAEQATIVKDTMRVSDKFLQQMGHIFLNQEENFLNHLEQRVEAAHNYFRPILQDLSSSILLKMNEINEEQGVKEYLLDLIALETQTYEQLKKMKKGMALIKAFAAGKELTKADVTTDPYDAKRIELAIASIASAKNADKAEGNKNYWKEKFKKKGNTESKARAKKGDSLAETFKLYKEGKSVAEIASARKLGFTTVRTHLISLIIDGKVPQNVIVSDEKARVIRQALKENPDILLTPLKNNLGDNYAFDEIKVVKALWEKETISAKVE